MTAKATISKAAMGKAFKGAVALAGGPLGVGLFALAEIADWMSRAQLRDDPSQPGVQIQMADPAVCSVAPCTQYGYMWSSTPVYVGSLQQVGAAVAARYASPGEACRGQVVQVVSINTTSVIVRCASGLEPANNVIQRTVAPSAVSWITPTASQIEAAASTPDMKPEWLLKLLESGVAVDASDSTLTGPASVAGPSSTSTKQIKDASGNVTGTQTVTNNTTYNITYSGNTYNVNTTTTTTTVNPDGTSTVETQTKPTPPEKDNLTDCDKYPNSVGCSELDVPEGEIPKATKNVTYAPETWFGGGSCPADKFLTTHGQQIKVWDWQQSCYWLVNYFRPILLIVASIAAMFIVLPKGDA